MKQLLETYSLMKNDGAIDCFISILTSLKNDFTSIDLKKIIEQYDGEQPYQSFLKLSKKHNLACYILTEITSTYLKQNKNISILKIDNRINFHFIICFSYSQVNGFKIYDPINGHYYATENGLNCIWKDKTAVVFIDN